MVTGSGPTLELAQVSIESLTLPSTSDFMITRIKFAIVFHVSFR